MKYWLQWNIFYYDFWGFRVYGGSLFFLILMQSTGIQRVQVNLNISLCIEMWIIYLIWLFSELAIFFHSLSLISSELYKVKKKLQFGWLPYIKLTRLNFIHFDGPFLLKLQVLKHAYSKII